MSNLEQILTSITKIVDQMNKNQQVDPITVFVHHGCHTIAVKVKQTHPLSKVMTACLNKCGLNHADYKLVNGIDIDLNLNWPSGILSNLENVYIKPK